ncbi:hypothetical protein GALL_473540 [mine drainage metagenome]|uniref:Uncharacterized protein n=1 Tax=mine drainage metagenome TaxID=410659 RepID=A0A1J5PTW2_9ZZZZ
MNVEAMRVDMHQPQSVEPVDVGLRHGGGISTIGGQRGVAALRDPRRHLRGIPQCVHHQAIMVTLQRNQGKPLANARQQPVDDRFAFRPLIDVIADRDNDAGLASGIRGDFSQTSTKQIASAVDVRDNVSQTHGTAAVPARIAGVNDVQPII